MKLKIYSVLYILAGAIIVGLFRRYVYENMWIGSAITGIWTGYIFNLYIKKRSHQPPSK